MVNFKNDKLEGLSSDRVLPAPSHLLLQDIKNGIENNSFTWFYDSKADYKPRQKISPKLRNIVTII